MIIFGVRSPLAVEYEETCLRAKIEVSAFVNVSGTPRVMATDKVVDLANFDPSPSEKLFLPCAFLPHRREELSQLGMAKGLRYAPAVVDPTAIVASSVRIDDGSFINAGAVIGAVSLLGTAVFVNRACSLGHHTMLGDFVSIGPGATLAGNIKVGTRTVVGAGSVILPDLRIGSDVIISAGSVVRRDVPDGTFVAGNPAVERPYDWRRGSLNIRDAE